MRKILYIPILLLTAALLTPACGEDDPVTPAGEHFDAVGVVLKTSGIRVAEIFEGQTGDTLTVALGQLGDAYDVYFLDEDRNELAPPDDAEKTFTASIADTTIVTFYQHEGEEGGYEFHLQPKKAGLTQIEFFILHAGHQDFRSGEMPVKVTE